MTTIDARWAQLEPGTVHPRAQHHDQLTTPADVAHLVDQLAQPHTSEAYLTHQDRPQTTSTVTGRTKADHGLVVGVWDGRGYAEYHDPTHYSQTVGEPDSPEWHTVHQGHFLPGSGIRLADLTALITEFLHTAHIPTCVRWRDLTPTGRRAAS
jgi:hypothetical protein